MPHNEDAMLVGKSVDVSGAVEHRLSAPFIAAVSDGVSGELSGELASKMCMELVRDIKYSGKVRLKHRLLEVHRKMAHWGNENKDNHNMQATLCGVAVDENGNVNIINVGDSRLYRFRGGRLRQLSRDQSLVQLLFEEGTITQEQLRTHVHRNIIFPVMGNLNTEPQIDVELLEGGIEYGDVLLLCTDGLSDFLSQLDIEEILELPKSLPRRLELLVQKALEKNCTDNITIVAVICC